MVPAGGLLFFRLRLKVLAGIRANYDRTRPAVLDPGPNFPRLLIKDNDMNHLYFPLTVK